MGLDVVSGAGRRSGGRDHARGQPGTGGHSRILAIQGTLEENFPVQLVRTSVAHDDLGAVDQYVTVVVDHLEVDSHRPRVLARVASCPGGVHGAEMNRHLPGRGRTLPARGDLRERGRIRVDVRHLTETVKRARRRSRRGCRRRGRRCRGGRGWRASR